MEAKTRKKIYRIRKLTPIEAMRLMGVRDDDSYKMKAAGISDTQLYKMAGNSIVVDVLMGIFAQMFYPAVQEDENQLKFPWM